MMATTKATIQASFVVAVLGLGSCATAPENSTTRPHLVDGSGGDILIRRRAVVQDQLDTARPPEPAKVQLGRAQTLDEVPAWLKTTTLDLSEPRGALSIRQLSRLIQKQGITITSALPLDDYFYNGFGVHPTTGDIALTAMLSDAGLDYVADPTRRLIEIVPMGSQTWRLNIGGRTASFTAEGESGEGESESGSGGSSAGQGGGGSVSGVTRASKDSSSSTLTVEDDFWGEISAEIESRLMVLLPTSGNRGQSDRFSMPSVSEGANAVSTLAMGGGMTDAGGTGSSGGGIFTETRIGKSSINRSTGAVTVQAPRHLLADIGQYLEQIQDELSTTMHFEGRLLLVTTDRQQSEGLDLSGFAKVGNNLGLAVQNNVLGGVTVSGTQAGSTPSVTTGSGIASTALGVVRADKLLSVFTGWLERSGEVTTIQRPMMSTTSGVPVSFSEFQRTYVNFVSEETASSENNATVARKNELVPFEFGLSLKIHPRFDGERNTIRAQIALTQTLQSGTQTVEQVVSSAGGGTQSILTSIPLDRRIDYRGETIIPDGGMIVLGGQTINGSVEDDSGLSGTRHGWFDWLFGRTQTTERVSTYYFVLTARAKAS